MGPEEYEKYEDEQAALLGVFGPEAQAQARAELLRRAAELEAPVGDVPDGAKLAPWRFEEWRS